MVNITMLVRDRFLLTAQALLSLKDNSKVTILDDRSQPPTASLIKEWARVTHNHSVRNDQAMGTGGARNLVIHASQVICGRGEYLYLSDNDVWFVPGWLQTLIGCYEESWKAGFKIVGAYCHPYHQPIGNRQWVRVDKYEVRPVHALPLQSMLMRWDVWDKYGPFCETPVDKVCQSEDVDFTNKIQADGGQIGVVSPALVVSTGITNTFGEKIPGWEMVQAQCPSGVICE